MTIIYVSNLPHNIFAELKSDYNNRITEAGFYTKEDIAFLLEDFGNHRLCDITESVDGTLWVYALAASHGTPLSTIQKLYKVIDEQDEMNYEYRTFPQAKSWLQDFWNTNPDEDMSDEEHDAWIEEIGSTTSLDEFHEMLQGIGYYMEEAF